MSIVAHDPLSVGSQEAMQMMREELRRLLIVKAAAAQQAPVSLVPTWCINFSITLGVHLLVAAILCLIVIATRQLEAAYPPMRMSVLLPPQRLEAANRAPGAISSTPDVQVQDTSVAAAASPQFKIEDEVESPDAGDAAGAQGRTEAISESEMGSRSAFMAIGVSGGGASGAGVFGNRGGSRKHRALAAGGGNEQSEAAVNRALLWFKRHQSDNGQWDGQFYPKNCTDSPKCETTIRYYGQDGDIAFTSLAVLCFLGAGYDQHVPSKFRITVQKGVAWLVSRQAPDGLLGNGNYEHAIATMALCEAYALSRDANLEIAAQKAVNVLLARQNKNPHPFDSVHVHLGWDYLEPSARNDSSVTGWNVMALKSALAAGLKVGLGLDDARVWFDATWHFANPKADNLNDPYHATSAFPYTMDSVNGTPCMTSVGALCALILGHGNGDIIFESLCNAIVRVQPRDCILNAYNMYYATLSLFQGGGTRWQAWNPVARDLLIATQGKGHGCLDGSWNLGMWGRFLDTAWYCLSLEVYYRYQRIAGH